MIGSSKIIVIHDFYSRELNNYRNIRVYLPRSYDKDPTRRFPVLYMHDGQNIFEPENNMFHKSWNVHKTADLLINEGLMKEIIIVGIDNNQERSSEYCHIAPEYKTYGRMGAQEYSASREAKGMLYEKFILNSLKPYIDANFRTFTDRENTAMMGSSMGGLVTYYIGFRHPEVFGQLGIISPALHWLDFNQLLAIPKEPMKVWMDTGEEEAYYVDNARSMLNHLLEHGFIAGKDIAYYQVPNAIHNEEDWAKRVKLPLLFLFGSIGRPVSCKITGRKEVGLHGMGVTVNPIVQYDSGFMMTDVQGKYTSDDPNILEIYPNGMVLPKACGTTKVNYEMDGVKEFANYTVIDYLPDTVRIELEITVPAHTPKDSKVFVYAGGYHETQRNEQGNYGLQFTIPRDWGYHFEVFLGEEHIGELDKDGQPVRRRLFQAVKDMKLECNVQRWAED